MPSLFYVSWWRCVSSNVEPCGAREDRYGNKLSPWGRESTAEPGEGTRVVDYTPQSPIPLPLFEVLPLFQGKSFLFLRCQSVVYSSRSGVGRVRRSRERVRGLLIIPLSHFVTAPLHQWGSSFFCVVSKVIRCSNKLSPWGRESTAKPGEGTRNYPIPKGIVSLLTTYPALRTGL